MPLTDNTTSDLSRASYEENNNTSPPLSSTSSSQPGCNSVVNNRRSCQSVSSLGSPISASMPSIAALTVNLTNNKNNVMCSVKCQGFSLRGCLRDSGMVVTSAGFERTSLMENSANAIRWRHLSFKFPLGVFIRVQNEGHPVRVKHDA